MSAPSNVSVGVAAWVENHGTLVLIKRSGTGPSGNGHGTYALPGGWIETDESIGQTVVREVMEEVGLKVAAHELMGATTDSSDDGTQWIVTLVVRCTLEPDSGEIVIGEPDKIAWAGWVDRDDIKAGDWTPLFAPLRHFFDADASGADRIRAERARQIAVEKWTPDHDARHPAGELAAAATCYAAVAAYQLQGLGQMATERPALWPWEPEWWKPSDDPARNLEKSGALAAAQIDAMNAAAGQPIA